MRDPAAAWELLNEADLICDAAQVNTAIRRVADEITARIAQTYPLVLTVMSGGVFFAGQLLPLLRFPIDLDYIHATRYGPSTVGIDVDWRVPPPEAVRGRMVLVLDDILDAGDTMGAIRDRILAQGAAGFCSAVLAEKEIGKAKPIAADFVGVRVPNRFVFGCGMDARGYWRNLPEIYAMKGS